MISQNNKHWLRVAAGAPIIAAMLTGGCKKPATAQLQYKNNSVALETGQLPEAGKANRLLNEQSAFLRRHAKDPVEWHPWGAEAFGKAKQENKPVLVSIGYASCPWSQKMHEESFTDAEIARFMNKHFVCVLVDREERPDINTAFLHFAFWRQKISGWPLHVWLTPGEALPIYQGIYFPKESAGSTPSWRLTLEHVANNWESSTSYVTEKAKEVADAYLQEFRRRWLGPPPEGSPDLREVKSFMSMRPDEQLSQFTSLPAEKLGFPITDLPSSKVEELWAKLTPETAAGLVRKLSATSAATLFAKLSGPAREPAFQKFIAEARDISYQKLRSVYDPVYGGFGPPPRFAPHQSLEFLLRYALRLRGDRFTKDREAIEMVCTTLDRMLRGGMNDQLAGGFHRYSTDIYWAVPQFEKMLYDQGYMAQVLVAAGQVSGRNDYFKEAARLLAYAGSELSHPQGGFYCAEGSSSPSKNGAMLEGAYYVWDKKEVDDVTGDAAPLVNAVFGIDERGNLPLDSSKRKDLGNTNVLMVKDSPEDAGKALGMDPATARSKFEEARKKLLEVRRKRSRPTLEDKVLTSWNGVVISGFARTGWAVNDDALTQRGVRAAEFIMSKLRSKDGALLHAFLDGPSPLPGYSEDYAAGITGLIDLYESTGAVRWLAAALDFQERQIKDLWDKTDGGFFDGPDTPNLFHRMKSMDEATEMSAGSASLLNLVMLSTALDIADFRDKARRVVERYGPQSAMMPGAFFRFLRAAEFLSETPQQIVISGTPDDPGRKELIDVLRPAFRPGIPLLYMDGADSEKFLTQKVPDLAALSAQPGKPAIHFCRGYKPEKSIGNARELAAYVKSRFTVNAVPSAEAAVVK